jgi:hypothetical protein
MHENNGKYMMYFTDKNDSTANQAYGCHVQSLLPFHWVQQVYHLECLHPLGHPMAAEVLRTGEIHCTEAL